MKGITTCAYGYNFFESRKELFIISRSSVARFIITPSKRIKPTFIGRNPVVEVRVYALEVPRVISSVTFRSTPDASPATVYIAKIPHQLVSGDPILQREW